MCVGQLQVVFLPNKGKKSTKICLKGWIYNELGCCSMFLWCFKLAKSLKLVWKCLFIRWFLLNLILSTSYMTSLHLRMWDFFHCTFASAQDDQSHHQAAVTSLRSAEGNLTWFLTYSSPWLWTKKSIFTKNMSVLLCCDVLKPKETKRIFFTPEILTNLTSRERESSISPTNWTFPSMHGCWWR